MEKVYDYAKAAPGGIRPRCKLSDTGPIQNGNATEWTCTPTQKSADFWTLNSRRGHLSVTDVLGEKVRCTEFHHEPTQESAMTTRTVQECERDRHNPGDIFVRMKATMPREYSPRSNKHYQQISAIDTLVNKEKTCRIILKLNSILAAGTPRLAVTKKHEYVTLEHLTVGTCKDIRRFWRCLRTIWRNSTSN